MDINQFLKQHKFKQCELAELMGVSPSYISQQKKAGFQVFTNRGTFVVVNPDNVHTLPRVKND